MKELIGRRNLLLIGAVLGPVIALIGAAGLLDDAFWWVVGLAGPALCILGWRHAGGVRPTESRSVDPGRELPETGTLPEGTARERAGDKAVETAAAAPMGEALVAAPMGVTLAAATGAETAVLATDQKPTVDRATASEVEAASAAAPATDTAALPDSQPASPLEAGSDEAGLDEAGLDEAGSVPPGSGLPLSEPEALRSRLDRVKSLLRQGKVRVRLAQKQPQARDVEPSAVEAESLAGTTERSETPRVVPLAPDNADVVAMVTTYQSGRPPVQTRVRLKFGGRARVSVRVSPT